jgi:hypothetical protein
MYDAKDLYLCALYSVGDVVRCTSDHQFSCNRQLANSSEKRKRCKTLGGYENGFNQPTSSRAIVFGNIFENVHQVAICGSRPNDLHARFLLKRETLLRIFLLTSS